MIVKKKKAVKQKVDEPEKKKDRRSAVADQIKELEDRISKTKYNKKTQHAIGMYKARLAQLKEKQAAKSSKGKPGEGYAVRKSGDASVILLGFPSAGKSSLLNAITNANSPVGAYEFTTLDVVPGLLEYKGAKIQILDVPGIVRGAASGKGRGKEVLSVLHSADLILILVDVLRPNAYKVILKEVYDFKIRLNQEKPDVKIRKTVKDGIRIGKTVRLPDLQDKTMVDILKEFRIMNAEVVVRSQITADQFIDVLEGNKVYIPAMTVVNKIDAVSPERLAEVKEQLKPDHCISAQNNVGTEELKELIFKNLKFIRIFCKEAGKKADMGIPLIMREGSTIEMMCRKLHKDFVTKFKFARVWGKSAKFPGQRLMMKHTLQDEDVVELHMH